MLNENEEENEDENEGNEEEKWSVKSKNVSR